MPHSADVSERAPVVDGTEVGRYGELFDASIADPEAFWADAARDVSWIREPAGSSTTPIRRTIDGSPTPNSIRAQTLWIATSPTAAPIKPH